MTLGCFLMTGIVAVIVALVCFTLGEIRGYRRGLQAGWNTRVGDEDGHA